MALSASTVWEVRTTGSDTNGGGYVSGGTDRSQQDSAQYAVSDGVTAGTTTITSATANFQTDVVGNIMYVSGGTGSVVAARYQIASRTNSTTIVVDRSTGLTAGTGVTLNIGGALASPGMAGGAKVAGNDIWIKSGTYTLTSSTSNIAGGKISDTTGGVSASNITRWEGYQTTRGDRGTKPVISAGAITTITVFSASGGFTVVDNIAVDGNSQTSITGFLFDGARSMGIRCHALNCTVIGISAGATNQDGLLHMCSATACSGTAGISINGTASRCETWANTCVGLSLNPVAGATPMAIIGCISTGNTGGTTDGFLTGGRVIYIGNCIAYGNGRNGFNLGHVAGPVENCIAESNTSVGFTNGTSTQSISLINCAVFGNGSTITNLPTTQGTVTGTGSFFTNAASGDFSLNNTSGAGAASRAAGYPGLSPRGTSTGYLDIGAIQHQDTASSGTRGFTFS